MLFLLYSWAWQGWLLFLHSLRQSVPYKKLLGPAEYGKRGSFAQGRHGYLQSKPNKPSTFVHPFVWSNIAVGQCSRTVWPTSVPFGFTHSWVIIRVWLVVGLQMYIS